MKINKKNTKNKKSNLMKIQNPQNTSSKLNINDLPLEILEKIIENIPIWHRNRIRLASKVLKYASDNLLLHKIKTKAANFNQRNTLLNNELITMKAIHQGTWAYVKKGFDSMFLGKMLALLRCHYDNSFSPTLPNCKHFLKQFYCFITEKFKNISTYEARLLYVLILLGYFQNIKGCEQVFSECENIGYWQIIYIIHGSWFEIYTNNNSFPTSNFHYIKDGFDILIILFYLMIATHRGKSSKNIYEENDKAYLICFDSRLDTNVKTFIIFNVFGSKKLFNFLLFASKNENWKELPKEEFQVNIKFYCKQRNKKKSTMYQTNIGPNCE